MGGAPWPPARIGRSAAPSPACLLIIEFATRVRSYPAQPARLTLGSLSGGYIRGCTATRSLRTPRSPPVLALVAMAAEGAPETAAAELNARPGRTLTERAHEAERRIVQKYNEHNASVADRFPKTGKTLTERAADAERKIAARYAVANDANAHNFPKTGKSLMERAAEAEKKRRENKAATYGKKPE